jgi:hypothetical protein
MKGNIENMFRTIADVVLQAGNKFAVGALLPLVCVHVLLRDDQSSRAISRARWHIYVPCYC